MPGEKTNLGSHVVGRFSFLAMYPFDTRVILRVPARRSPRSPRPYLETPEALRDVLNRAMLNIDPNPALFKTPALAFEVEPLGTIFVDSPNATWSALRAAMPSEWFLPLFRDANLPPDVAFRTLKAKLLLFDGGMAILTVEPTYALRETDDWVDNFPDLVKATLEQSVRYENRAVTQFCEALVNMFATRLQNAVFIGAISDHVEVAPSYEHFGVRSRSITVPEVYPTIITKIWCKDSLLLRKYDLKTSDLTRAMYLDESEMTNALPTFEDDFVAVGYDSIWWLLASQTEERADRFRDRVELTFQYSLAVSNVIYVLHAEIDHELAALRPLLASRGHTTRTDARVAKIRSLRGEVEDLLKEISLESFSTWVSDIYLFKSIMEHWFVDVSVRGLRAKIDAVNVILRELHQDNTEREQRELTRLGTIFAAASLAGLFVAAVTLLFTESHWEAQDPSLAWRLFSFKLFVVAYLLVLPTTLLWFIPKWYPRILRALKKIPGDDE